MLANKYRVQLYPFACTFCDSMQLECCGVMTFSDYEDVFNNFSVPVSCCNTTNPLANKTTCRESIVNAQEANQSNLIYSEVC